MKKKKKSLLNKTVLGVVIVGIVILAGVCAVASAVFNHALIDVYKELAYSFVKMVTMEIYTKDMSDIIFEHEKVEALLDDYMNSLSGGKPLDEYPEDEKKILQSWLEIDDFLFETTQFNSNLHTFQIVIPSDDGVLCLWYEASNPEKTRSPMTHRPYREGEEKALHQTYNLDDYNDEDLTIYIEDDQVIGTATYPIFDLSNDSKGVIAFAELDISVTSVRTAILTLMAAVGGLILLIMVISLIGYFLFLKRNVITPVIQLNQAAAGVVDRLKAGEHPLETNIHTGDELEALAKSFENMGESLESYIHENAAITAEKERLNTELDLAANIQAGMLPSVFPPFPDRHEFDIYASMKPAKEVGGDFYDYFFVDENTLVLVIADVSGKGVPASLFMMSMMVAIENLAAKDRSPASILEQLNKQVCARNQGAMFVTVWLGILDVKSGRMTAANAGHEYPVLCRPGGSFELYKDKHSFVVGGMKRAKYKEYELQLEPGATLFVYSDGLPEARNPQNEMFRMERVLEVLNQMPESMPEKLLEFITQSVNDFVQDAESFDDLTMLCIRYFGDEGHSKDTTVAGEMTVEATEANIPVVKEFVKKELTEAGFPEKAIKQVLVAAEELFVNIATYAYAEAEESSSYEKTGDGSASADTGTNDRPATIRLEITDDPKSAVVTFIDRGVPYDPVAKKDPDITLKAKDRIPGGLGIFLSKKLMDEITYEYCEKQNILKIVKRV